MVVSERPSIVSRVTATSLKDTRQDYTRIPVRTYVFPAEVTISIEETPDGMKILKKLLSKNDIPVDVLDSTSEGSSYIEGTMQVTGNLSLVSM